MTTAAVTTTGYRTAGRSVLIRLPDLTVGGIYQVVSTEDGIELQPLAATPVTPTPERLWTRSGALVDFQSGYVTRLDGARQKLTRTEFNVVTMLALSADRLVPTNRLAKLWGDYMGSHLLATHMSRLRGALGSPAASATDTADSDIETVRGLGYLLHTSKVEYATNAVPPALSKDAQDVISTDAAGLRMDN